MLKRALIGAAAASGDRNCHRCDRCCVYQDERTRGRRRFSLWHTRRSSSRSRYHRPEKGSTDLSIPVMALGLRSIRARGIYADKIRHRRQMSTISIRMLIRERVKTSRFRLMLRIVSP